MYEVTAVVTTYRRSWETIERAIRSIENQTLPVAEILLMDDNAEGSEFTDAIKAGLSDHPAVRYISQNGNFGVSAARNFAAENARGEFIAFLDDDDEWCADKIESQLALLEKHPDAGLVFGYGIEHDDSTGREFNAWPYEIFKEEPSYVDMLTHDYVASTSHPMIRTAALKEVGGFRKQPAVEDYELWLRISRRYPIYGEKKAVYIKHMDSGEHISSNHKNAYLGYLSIYNANKDAYKQHDEARQWIYYNIMREAVMGKLPAAIPYGLRWLRLKVFGKK